MPQSQPRSRRKAPAKPKSTTGYASPPTSPQGGKAIAAPGRSMALGTQPAHGRDVDESDLALLRQFDLNDAYGPCVGLTRAVRWNRAFRLGCRPPASVKRALTNAHYEHSPAVHESMFYNQI
ncbi:DNA polymerase delta subunit 4 [Dimargaris xerosporica]|nr:DNA polymerase delta subunit 4 [Dimargaris xerosporica]